MKKFIIPIVISCIGIFLICYPTNSRRMTIPMESVESTDTFTINQLCQEDYDSFYVVPPYYGDNFEQSTFKISHKMENDVINRVEMYDDVCVLLLAKDNEIQAYSVIPRNAADFADMEPLKGISTKEKLMLNSKRVVVTAESE